MLKFKWPKLSQCFWSHHWRLVTQHTVRRPKDAYQAALVREAYLNGKHDTASALLTEYTEAIGYECLVCNARRVWQKFSLDCRHPSSNTFEMKFMAKLPPYEEVV